MAKPVTDEERERVIPLLDEPLSYAAIGRMVGRSASTVANIARSVGHNRTKAGAHSRLSRAHEARSAFCAERRAKAAARAQERLEELLEDVWDEPVETLIPGAGGATALVKPSPTDRQRISQAVASLTRTVIDVDRHDNRDNEASAAEVDRWLLFMMGKSPGGDAK